MTLAEKTLDALGCIQLAEGERAKWYKVTCALASALGEAGLEAFQLWNSAQPHADAEKDAKAYLDACKSGTECTPATLFFYAEQDGWQNTGFTDEEKEELQKKRSVQSLNRKSLDTWEKNAKPHRASHASCPALTPSKKRDVHWKKIEVQSAPLPESTFAKVYEKKGTPARILLEAKLELLQCLSCLFSDGEKIAFTTSRHSGAQFFTLPELRARLLSSTEKLGFDYVRKDAKRAGGKIEKGGLYFCTNPTDGKGMKVENITDLRWALFETDTGEKAEQFSKLITSGLPVGCIVDTGRRSLHAFVKIEAGQDAEEYKRRTRLCAEYLKNALDFCADSTQNPNREARCAGGFEISESGAVNCQGLIFKAPEVKNLDNWEEVEKRILKQTGGV